MKKNLATVILLAFTILNLVLNCVIVFTLVPQNQKVNTLITEIASAIELDLTDDATSGTTSSSSNYSLDQIETYDLEDEFTVNLAVGADGSSSHVAVLTIALEMNTESEDYATYASTMDDKVAIIRSTLNSTISSFTYEEIQADKNALKDACVEAMCELFQSDDFIVGVSFSSEVYQ